MKNSRIHIRLTPAEKEYLQDLATKCDNSISELVRMRLLSPKTIFLDESGRKELRALLEEARKINRTLNLYHEKKQEIVPFLAKVRKFARKIK